MARTRKSKRGKKRNAAKPKTKASKPSSPATSDPETSPLKGFIEENVETEEKEDLFDKLLNNSDQRRALYKNIRTYSNKHKVKCVPNKELLEFDDSKNREEILRWLNNTENVFDRLTQTQQVAVSNSNDDLDLPSVSQQSTPKVREKKVRRSPYKLRAKSLDIQVTKNAKRGRNKRHSLARDTPDLGDYEIETDSDEEVPIPAEKGAIFVLMEDEYLDNLYQELEKTGWERIKDINKTINNGKRQPKKLKIFQISPEKKKPVTVTNNNNPSYDYDVLENYFRENMGRLISEEKKVNGESQTNGMFSVKNVLQIGENFITVLKKIQENGGQERLQEFEQLFNELKPLISFSRKNSDKNVQTESSRVTVAVQTEEAENRHVEIQVGPDLVNVEAQTEDRDSPVCDQSIQVEPNLASKEAQTENQETGPILRQVSSVTSATASDLMAIDEAERQYLCNAFDSDFDYNAPTQKVAEVFDDDPVFALNTEEFFKSETKEKTQESVLVVSEGAQVQSENKGVKRLKSESPVPDPERYRSKRPCAKFIREDLSVDVLSCAENEEESQFKEHSSNTIQRPSTPKKGTQEQIEEMEDMISNAIRTNRASKPEEACTKQVEEPKIESAATSDDSDYFEPYLSVTINEKSPKKVRRNLFDAKNSPCSGSESLFFEDANTTVVANRTLTTNQFDDELREILEVENTKINILQNVVVRSASDDDDADLDLVESTPQKHSSRMGKEPELDITLPPPTEFQDVEMSKFEPSPPRRPLAVINKVTSTPMSHRIDSENISLSPIEMAQENISMNKRKKALGPIELVQQSKYSPLTVVKKSLSQNVGRSFVATPKQKSILNYVRPSQEAQEQRRPKSFENSFTKKAQEQKTPRSLDNSFKQKPCIACSRISRDQVMAISSLTNRKLATYSTTFTPRVTHLIVSTNERNCLKDHTIKYVSAVAAGRWVLNFGWVKECLMKNKLVPEEPYEVLDVSGLPGPQQSRLTRTTDPLFKGYKIHAAAPFVSTTQKEVENVIRLLGGKIAPSPESLYDKNGYICVIVTEAKATQDFELYETWLEALKVVTVDIEWISRSVGQYQILSLRPFTLCSDENIEHLGYPPELTANATYSFSQQTFSTVPSKP